MNDSESKPGERKYKHDTKITFWASMPGNFTAKERETNTVGDWLGYSEEEVSELSDAEIESELEEIEREWLANQIEHGWYAGQE